MVWPFHVTHCKHIHVTLDFAEQIENLCILSKSLVIKLHFAECNLNHRNEYQYLMSFTLQEPFNGLRSVLLRVMQTV